jgi:hypothetical protein
MLEMNQIRMACLEGLAARATELEQNVIQVTLERDTALDKQRAQCYARTRTTKTARTCRNGL